MGASCATSSGGIASKGAKAVKTNGDKLYRLRQIEVYRPRQVALPVTRTIAADIAGLVRLIMKIVLVTNRRTAGAITATLSTNEDSVLPELAAVSTPKIRRGEGTQNLSPFPLVWRGTRGFATENRSILIHEPPLPPSCHLIELIMAPPSRQQDVYIRYKTTAVEGLNKGTKYKLTTRRYFDSIYDSLNFGETSNHVLHKYSHYSPFHLQSVTVRAYSQGIMLHFKAFPHIWP